MKSIVLGVGDFGVSKTPDEVIKTFALGSCVAVMLLHPRTKSVGMVHVALPDSKINLERARERPGYFADTGIPALVEAMAKVGASGNGRDFIVKLAGGAKVMDAGNTFNIGKRNVLAIKKILWKKGMGAVAEDVGGTISRTVAVSVDTGKILLSSAARGEWEI
ncbi:MAG: chemotaxis protein CheD [Thermodesulfobacteriota bacterium]|nr:chemotaxis protein CheD [Thermodesulfobacteriota bacterium]